MTDRPELIFAKPNQDEWFIGGWDTHGKSGGTEYIRADLFEKIMEDALRLAAIECMLNAAKAKCEGRGDYIAHEMDADAILAIIGKGTPK
jgi:hypothetical protein